MRRASVIRAFQLIETGSEAAPVGKLTEEDEGSRDALHQQAAVEQATGWLAGRLDYSLSEACAVTPGIRHPTRLPTRH